MAKRNREEALDQVIKIKSDPSKMDAATVMVIIQAIITVAKAMGWSWEKIIDFLVKRNFPTEGLKPQ